MVIRPIAFKPVVSPGVPQGVGPPTSKEGSPGGSSVSSSSPGSQGVPGGRPDTRYISTPSLARGTIHHYGSK